MNQIADPRFILWPATWSCRNASCLLSVIAAAHFLHSVPEDVVCLQASCGLLIHVRHSFRVVCYYHYLSHCLGMMMLMKNNRHDCLTHIRRRHLHVRPLGEHLQSVSSSKYGDMQHALNP